MPPRLLQGLERGEQSRARPAGRALRSCKILACLCLVMTSPLQANSGNLPDLIAKYEGLLLLHSSDYKISGEAKAGFEDSLSVRFRRAVRDAGSFPYDRLGELAYYAKSPDSEEEGLARDRAERQAANRVFHKLFNQTLPTLAFAYRTPGTSDKANPYYQNAGILELCRSILEYSYSRGLTEHAWLPDHAGSASADALAAGLVRTSGDFSEVSLRLGGFIQSVFLLREALAEAGLLAKYRAVVRNLVVNHGTMHGAFFHVSRTEAGIAYPNPLPINRQYHLNSDGARLLADYFWPYYLLIDDATEQSTMAAILHRVIETNIAIKPGVQSTIKPDGTGFHHATAYMGAYSPFTLEAFARLLYLTKGTSFYRTENVEAVKLAVDSYRVMVQKYRPSAAFRGRLIGGNGEGISAAVSKAMVFLAHPDGMDDLDMKARFGEFFDEEYFFSEERQNPFYEGGRGMPIRGLGIYRLIAELHGQNIATAETPSGAWIKPYAAAGFFRRGNWLVTAKGFSRYFWDYEGNLDANENSFGHNWAYGSLMVFSAGDPISEEGSGYALFTGWDWYHVPGTTASHFPIEERKERALRASRKAQGIEQLTVDRNYNSKSFVGGVSLGDHGFFVQDLEAVPFTAPTDLRARKSYFFVGDKVLAIGSHISGGTEDDATHTTIFQTYLEDTNSPTKFNEQQLTGLSTAIRHSAGTVAKMTDSVGNSFFLAASTADLVVSRRLQISMSESYETTVGAFTKALLDHGIKPEGHSYQYVVIPADTDATKLEQLAADPSAYYRVLDDAAMHLVRFPQQNITAYAFYEAVETPADTLIRTVNQPAAVIIQEGETTVRLAASVPDIGWRFDSELFSHGLRYASSQFASQLAKKHTLSLMLRGTWCPDETVAPPGTESVTSSGQTLLELQCRDGLGTEVLLRNCGISQHIESRAPDGLRAR